MPDQDATKKVVINFTFKASLGVYTRMDSIGTALAPDFPHWERSPLKVELRNIELHERFTISHDTCYFEANDPSDVSAATIKRIVPAIDNALRKLEVNKLERVGVVQFIAPKADKTFSDLLMRIQEKLFVPFSSLSAFDDCRLADLAYLVCATERDSKWMRTMQAGPMTREEYWGKFPLDIRLVDLENRTMNSFRESIPENFIFLSADTACRGVDRQFAINNIYDAAQRAGQCAQALLDTIMG